MRLILAKCRTRHSRSHHQSGCTLDRDNKGKSLVLVALIGALATVAVPLIQYWFPSKVPAIPPVQQKPSSAQQQGGSLTPSDSSTSKTVITRTKKPAIPAPSKLQGVSKIDPDEAKALGREYLKAKEPAEALRAFKQASVSDPLNGILHSCVAELSVQEGLIDQAVPEFRTAAQLGENGMKDFAARVQANRELLVNAHAYQYRHRGATDADFELYTQLTTARIPGTGRVVFELCQSFGDEAHLLESDTLGLLEILQTSTNGMIEVTRAWEFTDSMFPRYQIAISARRGLARAGESGSEGYLYLPTAEDMACSTASVFSAQAW